MSTQLARPLVSVVIPSYNHARFLEATIGSVVAQTYRPLELVVVDDGSSDGSVELLRKLFTDIELDKAVLLEQPNRGAHAAIMRGIEASSGELVAILNSDDFYHPERFERLLPQLLGGRHDLVFSGVQFVDTNGDAMAASEGWPQWYRTCLDETADCPTVGFGLLVHNFSVSSGNFLFRRGLYDNLSGFSDHRFTHDWDFLIRSLHYSEPAFVREPLISYRIHEGNTTETVRHLLRDEAGDALRRYISLVSSEKPPNPLAPCPHNWPRYFDRFAASCPLHFAPETTLAEYWKAHRPASSAVDDHPERARSRQRQLTAKAIAFYLPQYHPIPENDRWWGKGFTEWSNVSKAKPLFEGHYQPHLPTDLGFYDLRLPEVRQAQADLARQAGIYGFCYYHYWFKGRRLLERPFNEVLASGKPDFPFCLCWANETWSRRWLGEEKDILQKQDYSEEDDLDHARWLVKAFADRRYVTVAGRPLFLIYRPRDLPHPEKTTKTLRRTCLEAGLQDPYLVGVDAHCPGTDCRDFGFDHTLNFMPQLGNLPEFMNDEPSETKRERNSKLGTNSAKLKLYDYSEAMESMLANPTQYSHPVIPSVFVRWDNTPRRDENAIILVNDSPDRFERYLRKVLEMVDTDSVPESLVFINAWNEWAEGNYLEPDNKFGRGYLDAVRNALDASQK